MAPRREGEISRAATVEILARVDPVVGGAWLLSEYGDLGAGFGRREFNKAMANHSVADHHDVVAGVGAGDFRSLLVHAEAQRNIRASTFRLTISQMAGKGESATAASGRCVSIIVPFVAESFSLYIFPSEFDPGLPGAQITEGDKHLRS